MSARKLTLTLAPVVGGGTAWTISLSGEAWAAGWLALPPEEARLKMEKTIARLVVESRGAYETDLRTATWNRRSALAQTIKRERATHMGKRKTPNA